MPYLDLPDPDWAAIVGGSEKEARWLADRDRKFGLIAEKAERFLRLAGDLERRGALFHATPEILRRYPHAVDWYISLAGYALNTLQNIREAPANYGLSVRAGTVRRNLLESRDVSERNLRAFCDWINDDIEGLYPAERQTSEFAMAVVFGLLGGRAVGQGQNVGGDDGVILLARELVKELEERGHLVEVDRGEGFVPYEPEEALADVEQIRMAGRIVFDLRGGGNRPDIQIRDRSVVIANGEIKARKDISNVWESWMPQVVDHMRTWSADSPDAVRLFFGTLVTEEMVRGGSRGDRRSCLESLYGNGLLTNAYNISKLASGDDRAVRSFERLIDSVEERLPE